MASRLTTHALDTEAGCAAGGMKVSLSAIGAVRGSLADVVLDDQGRGVLAEALAPGVYEIVFQAGDYHRTRGVALTEPPFLDQVAVRFGVADGQAHYHVPLLLTRFSYSTYRGG
jgi:5-hydroxyisourate hydrolase